VREITIPEGVPPHAYLTQDECDQIAVEIKADFPHLLVHPVGCPEGSTATFILGVYRDLLGESLTIDSLLEYETICQVLRVFAPLEKEEDILD